MANLARAELTMTPLLPDGLSGESRLEFAMTVDDNQAVLNPAQVYLSGNDLHVIIFNKDFTVAKEFDVRDVNTDTSFGDVVAHPCVYSCTAMDAIVVTRNFFVKNDKWCIALHKGDIEDEFTVIDEDGNVLGDIPAGDIYLTEIFKGTPYFIVWEYASDHMQLYTFTGTNGIEAVKAATIRGGYPNPLPAGETFNVDFEKSADDATFFTVVDMSGRQVLRRRIARGETSFRLSGARFAHGHYIYTVIYGDGSSVSGRLMAE